jgi:ornithine decarboxylase
MPVTILSLPFQANTILDQHVKGYEWLQRINDAQITHTPYMLTDLAIVKEKCLEFKKLLPEVKLYYAVKAYSDPEVIHAIKNIVDGYDAASIEEIYSLLTLGVDPATIAYSNPVKAEQAIAEAFRLGINNFAFQSLPELEKIARQAPGAKVYIRTKMDDKHSGVPLSAKFGCPQEHVFELMRAAKRLKLNPIGITFHVGSQSTDIHAWEKAIRQTQALMDAIREDGIEADVINIGGGFPVQYSPEDPTFLDVSVEIAHAIAVGSGKGFKYMAEPGRFLAAESSVIVSSVIGVEDREGKSWLYLDTGVFQSFLGAMRFHPFLYPPYSLDHSKGNRTEEVAEFILTGPTCDSHDIIAYNVALPRDIKVGDRLVFPKTGAYTIVYGGNFNGFSVPPRYFINGQDKKEMRKGA